MMKVDLENVFRQLAKDNSINSVSTETATEVFLAYIKANRRQPTYDYYASLFKTLTHYFELLNVTETKQIDTDLVNKIINICKQDHNKNTTINKKIKCLLYMTKYLHKIEMISEPNIKFEALEADEERFSVLSHKDVDFLLCNMHQFEPKKRLIFRLMLITGVRRTEICYIRLVNINFEEDSIYLEHTKNKKHRYIFFDAYCKDLINLIKPTCKTYLFEMSPGEHIRADYVSFIFHKIKKDLNFEGNLSPHVLRHTFATTLLENDVDLESIRLLLGHSNYSMLKRYIHVKNKSLKRICLTKGLYSDQHD